MCIRSRRKKLPSVQVGDPFTEKVLIECCLELYAADLVVGIQDLGAAGISCGTSELASNGDGGMPVDLDTVLLRHPTLTAAESPMSGSQEPTTTDAAPVTRAEFAAEIKRVDLSNADLTESLVNVDLGVLKDNEELHRFAVQAGRSVFAANCSQCHGAGAGGVVASGYPNLLDDDWLWGGTMEDIAYTVRHGIRNEDDNDAHFSEMPPFDWMENAELDATVHFVRSLSGSLVVLRR